MQLQIGSAIGNGHPIGAVICTREIARSMDGYYSTFGGNPVACVMATAVLRVLTNERLLSSANNVGDILLSLFKNVKVIITIHFQTSLISFILFLSCTIDGKGE